MNTEMNGASIHLDSSPSPPPPPPSEENENDKDPNHAVEISNHHEGEVEEEGEKDSGDDVLGVSVHWLTTGFLEELQQAGFDSKKSTMHDIEDLQCDKPSSIIRSKGKDIICPNDGQLGCSYVHALQAITTRTRTRTTRTLNNKNYNQEQQQQQQQDTIDDVGVDDVVVDGDDVFDDVVGKATHMLSYSWQYTIGDVINALMEFCLVENLNPKTTFLWMDCLCINQHRVVQAKQTGQTGLLNFESDFPILLQRIGHMLAMMVPWESPLYLKRIWCVYELYVAHELMMMTSSSSQYHPKKKIQDDSDTGVDVAVDVAVDDGGDDGGGGGGVVTTPSCKVSIVLPLQEKRYLDEALFGENGHWDRLYSILPRTKEWIRTAESSYEQDKDLILGIINKQEGGLEAFSNKVNDALRICIRGVLDRDINALLYGKSIGNDDDDNDVDNDDDNPEKLQHQQQLERAEGLNYVACFLCKQYELDLAMQLFHKCAQIRETILGTDHAELSPAYCGIGDVYCEQGNFEASLTYHQRALVIEKREYGTHDLNVAWSYFNIGRVLGERGDYDLALIEHHKALAIRLDKYGPIHPRVALSHTYIGRILQQKGEYAAALEKHRLALEIMYESATTQVNHPELGEILTCTGMAMYSLGDYDDALMEFEKALNIQESMLGSRHPDCARTYQALGRVLAAIGEWDDAMRNHTKAVKVFESILGKQHTKTALAYRDIGTLFETKGEMNLARIEYSKALQIQESILGKDHPETVRTALRLKFCIV